MQLQQVCRERRALSVRPTGMTRAGLVCLAVVLATAGCTGQQDDEPGARALPPSAGPSDAAGSVPAGRYTLAADGAAVDQAAAMAAVQRCLDLPGVSWKPTGAGDPSRWRVTAGALGLREFAPCVEKVVGYVAVPVADTDAAFVEQCTGGGRQFVVPSYIWLAEDEALRMDPHPKAREPRHASARVVARDGDCLPVTKDLRPDRVDLVVRAGQVVWAGLPDTSTPGGPVVDDGIGVDICLAGAADCRSLDPATARRIRLALALDNAQPVRVTGFCPTIGQTYTVKIHYGGGGPQDVTVPSVCAPMTVNGEQYPLDDFVREQVRLAYEAAE